jgi:hypothetical protein
LVGRAATIQRVGSRTRHTSHAHHCVAGSGTAINSVVPEVPVVRMNMVQSPLELPTAVALMTK